MRRTGFKKPTYSEFVKSKSKKPTKKVVKKKIKKKVESVSSLHKKVWEQCREIADLHQQNNCYTCGAVNITGHNKQLGHGISKGSLSLQFKYDTRNLKWQCMYCNIHQQGNQEIFLRRLETEQEGLNFLNEACNKNEHGAWVAKKLAPINAREFLKQLLEKLKQHGTNIH